MGQRRLIVIYAVGKIYMYEICIHKHIDILFSKNGLINWYMVLKQS